jgi:hypothetical protein
MELLVAFAGIVSLLAALGWASIKYGVDSRTPELLKEKKA